jgi:hypothetical protein
MPSSGTPLLARTDFRNATGDIHVGMRDMFPLNISGVQSRRWWKHFETRKELAGGERIDWFYTTGGNASFRSGVLPGEFRVPVRRDTTQRAFLDYVRHTANAMILDDDFEKNDRKRSILEMGDADAHFEVIFSAWALAMSKADVDIADGMEADYGAAPNFGTMNSTSTAVASKMMSFFAHLNEDFLGLYGIVTATGITGGSAATDFVTSVDATGGGKWTSKQGLNPNDPAFLRALDSGRMYAPTKVSYTTTVASGANAATNIVSATKEAIRKSQYEQTPTFFRDGKWVTIGENEDLYMLTSNRGLLEIESAVLSGQNLWVTEDRQDPTVRPHFGRGKIHWWPILDTAAIYTGGTLATKVTEMAATVDNDGPRVYGVRSASFYPVCHDLNYFRVREMPRHVNVPDQDVTWIDTDCNLKCDDYRAQFVVSPSGNVY